MDKANLPANAPQRKEIDIYVDRAAQIDATVQLIERKLKNIEKTRDLVAVVHGIGPMGCSVVGAIMLKVRELIQIRICSLFGKNSISWRQNS